MALFIETEGGNFISLSQLGCARRKDGPRARGLALYDRKNRLLGHTGDDPDEIMVEIMPAAPGWLAVTALRVAGGSEAMLVPIIAWAVNMEGGFCPVPASDAGHSEHWRGGEWAVKREGDPRVFTREGAVHDTVADWLKDKGVTDGAAR